MLSCTRVAVLDGGYPAWQAEGYEVDASPVSEHDVQACARAAALPQGRQRYIPEKQVSSMHMLLLQHCVFWDIFLPNFQQHSSSLNKKNYELVW